MTEAATSATAQIEAMNQALEAVEAQMLEGSADGRVFHQLRERRERMQAELQRLEYAAKREAAESERAHLAALHDRLAESCDRADALSREGEAINAEIMGMVAGLGALVARGGAITREIRSLASVADGVATALRRAGEVPQRVGIGDLRYHPDRETAVACWQAAHGALEAAGLSSTHTAAIDGLQQRKRA